MNVKCGFKRSSVFGVWEVDSSGDDVGGGGGGGSGWYGGGVVWDFGVKSFPPQHIITKNQTRTKHQTSP